MMTLFLYTLTAVPWQVVGLPASSEPASLSIGRPLSSSLSSYESSSGIGMSISSTSGRWRMEGDLGTWRRATGASLLLSVSWSCWGCFSHSGLSEPLGSATWNGVEDEVVVERLCILETIFFAAVPARLAPVARTSAGSWPMYLHTQLRKLGE